MGASLEKYCIVALALAVMGAAGLRAQDQPVDETVKTSQENAESATADAVKNEKSHAAGAGKETVDSPRVRPAAAKADARAESPKNAVEAVAAGGLLDIQDGDFIYRRIPEKKFPEAAQSGLEEFEIGASTPPAEEVPDLSQRKGLFGLSARTTDYIAKGFLAFIVIVIFVLYRMRARTRRSTVHKSFR